jgi:chromosome transmission fidelity protein 18
LGKTTLAHVVASQAGYNVFEINARCVPSSPELNSTLRTLFSDARSGQVVEERIRPALESGYAVGSSKPVLIVIDEIDGATGDNVSTNVLMSETYIKSPLGPRIH